jgi:hypothetical protein
VGWLALFLDIQEIQGPAVVGWGRLAIKPSRFAGKTGLDALAELVVEAVVTDPVNVSLWRDVLHAQVQLRGPSQHPHPRLDAWLRALPQAPPVPPGMSPLGYVSPPVPSTALESIAIPRSPIDLALLVERATLVFSSSAEMVTVLSWAMTKLPAPWFQLCVARILPEARRMGFMGQVGLAMQSDKTFRKVAKRFGATLKM